MTYNQLTREIFIERAKKLHGNKYDYSKVEYVNNHTKVCIICPIHGEFWQTPMKHLIGRGCYECSLIKRAKSRTSNKEEFIKKARKIHGMKYDYSKVEYVNNRTKVCIICPIHGEFWQTPNMHLNGYGCRKCQYNYIGELFRKKTDKFIEEAKEIHGDKYDYSKVKYKNDKTKVCIICPKHGEFWQTPRMHLQGQGCPTCNESQLEILVRNILSKEKILFEEQKKFNWLKFKKSMRLDFYLPEYNVAIECQGIQHFIPVDFAKRGKKWVNEQFILSQQRDKTKLKLCKENGIKLLYYSNLGIEYPYKVFENKELLLKEIRGTA